MKTLDDIIACVQSYALNQAAAPVVYKIEPTAASSQLLWLPQSFRELISIRNPNLFIFFSYQAILGRAPDQDGAGHYHELLSSGRLSLRKFALQMLSSTESVHSNSSIKINKIDRYFIALENKILSIWSGRRGAGLIGRIHDTFIRLSSINSKHIQQNAFLAKQSYDFETRQEVILSTLKTQQINLSQQLAISSDDIRAHSSQQLEQRFAHYSDFINQQLFTISHELAEKIDYIHQQQEKNTYLIQEALDRNTELAQKSLADSAEKIAIIANTNSSNSQAMLYIQEKMLQHLKSSNAADIPATAQMISPHTLAADPAIDAYYLAFESKFRGPEDEIKVKLEKYIPYVEPFLKASQAPLLDIGMGRGEWINLISHKGLKAQGVDQSDEMIRHCRDMGLSVVHADALDYLCSLPEQSLGAISSFHVVEHLPFDILFKLIKESYRALLPGGLLILETPNPENVLVGSHTFYHDFSHKNPVTPTSLQFLAEYHGFKDCEILRLNPYPESAKVPGHDLLTERVNGHLCGPQDYALIAKR
ncbi:methyltransferase domain-containing protein [Iodobacter sp. LRB]|uniref:methyltransferase domain-containing protein n=1 Tax=unclassified Iodobacter TaxID=235634 RepID=UPI000C0FABFC|nr:methyltransferase domain-containing protein [Iodobacter sp. BJB302]PHV03485.1 hypothetical protein CSQ88_01880 [Iodobacter sp. BJB302]